MAEGNEDKIIRTSLESLVINVTNDEFKYRDKYLPDPRRLSDDKIVCTVCSVSLASRVRKGKNIYIHAILRVLVCKDCHSFYGDGIFSADEDGDDKYCRWCGQGGTLYLCSKCNCGFCKKCMTKNMKNSALAEVEKDNWKCLICFPRPIFGSRAVCWASRELNNSVRKNEILKQRLEEEKLRLESEDQLTENEEGTLRSSVKNGDKTKKRVHDTEDSDSSTVFIPAKKLKGEAKTSNKLNGSVKKHRRKYESSSSDSESSDDDHSSKWEKRKRKKEKKGESFSSEESSTTSKKKKKKENLKKKSKQSSDESSDSEEIVPKTKSSKKSHKKSLKAKRKKKQSRRRKESTSDSSSSESVEKPRKKKTTQNKVKSLSDTSSEEDKRKTDRKEKQDIVHKKDDISGSDCSREIDANNKEINNDEGKFESEVSLKSKTSEKELENETSDGKEKQSLRKSEFENGNEKSLTEKPSAKSSVLVNELQTLQNDDEPALQNSDLPEVDEELTSSQQVPSSNEDEFTLSYHESTSYSDEKLSLSQEDEVKVKVHLAIEWLESVSCDIADLGSLITERTNKFGKRKVNLENLCSYEDVLLTLEKLKQLLGGIHINYKQIEDSLEDKLQSWKILAGLEKSDLEEQLYDEGEREMQTEAEVPAVDEISTAADADTRVDESELQGEDPHSGSNEGENEFLSEVSSSVLPEEDKAPSAEPEIRSTCMNDGKENDIQVKDSKDIVSKEAQDIFEKENLPRKAENKPNDETILEEADNGNEATLMQELESDCIDNAMVKAELNLKSGSSSQVWSGLLSSDDDSDLTDEISPKPNSNDDIEKLNTEDNQEPGLSEAKERNRDNLLGNQTIDGKADLPSLKDEVSGGKEGETAVDTANFEALQELLYSSTEPEIGSSDSDSDDSGDFQLDDSDLENLLKPRKVIVKKSKNKDPKVKEESNKDLEVKIEEEEENERNPQKETEAEKKVEEPVDSEAEIDMLTDLSKLKKKTLLRRVEEEGSSEESSSDGSQEDDDNDDHGENKKRRKKYNNEIKKKREEERNELFGFLQGDSSAEDEVDITKNDLDVMEDQYVSESSDSMSLETFSRKMNEKYRELEQEQDQLNLQMLLASESEQGSVGEDDLVLDSDENKKKKKGKKIKEEKINEDENKADVENGEEEETEVNVKEEKEEAKPDEEYEQFLEDLTKNRTTFTGLGSSSEEDKGEEEIEIKEEQLSDPDTKVKKEPRGSDEESSSNSDSSADLFLDLTKRKSEKKTVWRQHKLLRMKLSDTDTSDEERWWQRRLEREKKKKEQGDSDSSNFDEFARALSSKKSHDREKKKEEESGSDKENKKVKRGKKHNKDEEASSSSTLEMSSTDSSGSEIFRKKKKKKRGSSDSDVMILSDAEKKKKKKKKRTYHSGESSNDSDDSDDDVIDITQKNSQGESPGKGGRKNIRKVLTKHELAAATKAAAKEEEERKKRIAARQKLFNEMFEIKEAEVLEKLVLDFDPETKTELISVDRDLVTKMKPHQAKGVKFMWDSCFESLSQLKTKKGSGCILAHCMGLGKTFQVVSLVHTILTHKDTNVRTVLVVCPLSTVLNWYSEFDKWLEDVAGGRTIRIYHLTKFKKAHERSKQLSLWHRTGGVMVLGYEMFRILANPNSKKFRLMHSEVFQNTLIDPGADLVVCDEGHMLKNESTLLSKAMSRIRTLRRIVLTGTPMQNNLKEYHCMVQFVKPNLLGTRKEFLNQFVNPITNGQFVDSTEADVKVMKRRAHVLHKMLEGLVQRFDYSVLTPFLPPKNEYVISLRLSDVQVKLYQFYLDYFCQKSSGSKRTSSQLFQDWQVLGRIWTHPRVLKLSTDKAEKEKQVSSDSEDDQKKLRSQKSIKDFFKKKSRSSSSDSSKQDSEDEGSIKDFINDKSDSSSLNLSSSSDDENGEKKDKTKKTKEEKAKKDEKEPENKTSVAEALAAEFFDEINLISSEEEDGDKKEEAKENQKTDKEGEMKANDSGIEDQEGKTGDELNAAEEKPTKTDSNDKDEKENKNDGDEKENKEDEKQENKEEKTEKEKKKTEPEEQFERRGAWWKDIIEPQHLEDINQSAKLVLLFAILWECEMIEDKVLVFSQSLFSLDLIEFFLQKVDRATEENRLDESLGNHAGCWQRGLDYFRLDGSSSSESRSAWCKSFNRDDNPRARLFLISTRAGGLGINLTGANRVVIFDASWNPSHDIQSIFRIYRFGQKKPCYVYRFVAHGTMEEKVYDRQVAKQLLSSRVVDEQQVHRHFSMNDLNELYTFTPPQERVEKPTPVLPRDRLMAELLTQYSDCIEKYHEHDSLLENIAEEELNEEERQLAWEDYENEKKRGFPTPTPGTGVPNFPGVANQMELFRKSLRLKPFEEIDSEICSDSSTSDPLKSSSSSDSKGFDHDTHGIVEDTFPNATDSEMNAMLQTLMYQVNYRTMAQVGAQPKPGQQVNAGPSQQPQNFRPMHSNNVGTSQPFVAMKNQVYQKYFGVQPMQQRIGTNIANQQRMGSGPMNQQIVGNGQIRKTNRTSQEIYMEQMRKQQETNLARIQSQRRFQRQAQQSAGQQPTTSSVRQPPVNRVVPQATATHSQAQQGQNMWKSNQTQKTQNMWKSNQPLNCNRNRLQQMQKQRENAVNIISARKPLQVSPVKPVVSSPQRSQWKTPQQKQEEMRQRIKAMQQKKDQQALQQKLQQTMQKGSLDPAQQRRLEEMKKRYNASRMKSISGGGSTPISIVEIDDEPGT